MKSLIIALVLVMVLSIPALAEGLGIHGETSFKYELAEFNPGQSWKIDLHYNFTGWLTLGFTETTFTNGYTMLFNAIPAFYPANQLYEVYGQINFSESASIKICQWCNHPVWSGFLTTETVPSGLYVEGSYRF